MFEASRELIHANSVANIYQHISKYSFKTKARSQCFKQMFKLLGTVNQKKIQI